MEKNIYNELAGEITRDRMCKAAAALKRLKVLPEVYRDMQRKGYVKEMALMREVIIWQLMLDPETTEEELIKMVMPSEILK